MVHIIDDKIEDAKVKLLAIRDAQILDWASDVEREHIAADDILLDLIDDEEIRELFDSIHKWYA